MWGGVQILVHSMWIQHVVPVPMHPLALGAQARRAAAMAAPLLLAAAAAPPHTARWKRFDHPLERGRMGQGSLELDTMEVKENDHPKDYVPSREYCLQLRMPSQFK